ncbi:hypothetical protein HPP92_022805 [Vanilla planifolia]|uniref:Uncharacterized protein n=1 Tax=Vanilla planifolia TaxID=51239 RepID=A0A835PRK3_VANPL|nr:hypothetical protein HPP92_022805 [Vanilla planifolia]
MHQLANLTFLAIENVASMYHHYMKQQRQFNGRFTTLKAEPKEELISETVLQTVHFLHLQPIITSSTYCSVGVICKW